MNENATIGAGRRLDGWKAIARYLGRDRTTAMRWAAGRGLPVHQLPGGKRASVYAFGHELDAWMAGANDRHSPSREQGRREQATPAPGITRRKLVAGGLVAAGVGLAGVEMALPTSDDIPSDVQSMMEQGRLLRDQNTRETQNQAIGLYREATRLAPYHADAWGLLGYTCASASHWRDRAEGRSLRELAAIAAKNALRLDRSSATGELATATALPYLGRDNWLARDWGLRRALRARPAHPDVLFARGFILRFTGQIAEAETMCARIEARHYTPAVFNIWIRSLWSAGRTDEARLKIDEAALRFSGNRMLWLTRLEVLMFGGRPAEAVDLARDVRDRPSTIAARELETLVRLAEALRDAPSARTAAMMQDLLSIASSGTRNAINAMRFAALTGHLDLAFAITDAYFFGRGFCVADDVGGGLVTTPDQRHTNFLFEPPLAAMRADPRFAILTDELGLARYWHAAGEPDYLRSGAPSVSSPG